MRGVFQKRILLSALTGGFFLFAPGAAQSAITGTGTCAGITSPLTADLVCDGDVYVDNGSLLDLGNDVANVTLDVGSGTICIGSDATPPCNTLTGTGTILVDPPGPTGTFGTINAANIVIGAGSALHADGSGCGPSESYDPGLPGCVDQGSGAIPGFGEGADDLASLGGGGGAGYGGPGGAGHANSGSTLNPPGDSYGSTELTTLMAGSGGGNNNDPSFGAPGGAGGGAIHISVSGTLTHNGRISADGSNGSFTGTSYNGGGGSGGSLLISAGTLTMGGGGIIRANGGNGGPASSTSRGGGGGGGGRVRIDCNPCPLLNASNLQSMGGAGGRGAVDGSAGTLLVVDNSGVPFPIITLGGSGILPDIFDGTPDGNHNYATFFVQDAGTTGDIRSQGPGVVNGNLHIDSAFDFSGSVIVNGNFTSNAPPTVSGGVSTVNGSFIFSTPGYDLIMTGGELSVAGDITLADTISVAAGSLLRMSGDNTLSASIVDVSGELVLDADGTNPAQPYSLVQVTTMTINAGGAIHADGTACGPSQSFDHASTLTCVDFGAGVSAGFGEGADTGTSDGASGGGYGNLGGIANGLLGGNPYGFIELNPLMPGSGGGNNTWTNPDRDGGAGGGAMKLEVSGTLTLDGQLRANGEDGISSASSAANSGGGSGGGLFIDAGTLTLGAGGLVQANGGAGGTGNASTRHGGSGSGGRIRIDCVSCPAFTTTQLQAMGGLTAGGATSAYWGGVGSVLVVDRSVSPPHIRLGGEGVLNDVLDASNDGIHNYTSVTALLAGTTADKRSLGTPVINGDLSLTGALNVPVGALQLNGDTTAATVLVSGTGILSIDGFNALNATTVNVTGGAGAEINSVPGAGMISIVADDLTVDFGNFIRTDGLGCGASQSFDHATTFTCVNFGAGVTAGFGEGGDYAFSAGGAGYGGVGGIGNGGSGGAAGDVYGATGLPLHLGSGGGDASVPGGAGGGAFNLDISGTLQVDGILSANGAAGGSSTWPGGGGSGGGIHIFTGNLQGAGTITANGGAGGNASAPTIAGGGGGGGGRILINYSGSNTFINPLSCTGGAGGSPSGLPGGGGSCPAPALGSKTTTLGNGNDPAPMTVEPGTMGVVLDAFSFSSNSIDTVTALTVTTTNTVAISKVEIWDAALTTQYFSSVTVPSGNDWNFSGGLAIPSLPVLPPAPFSVVVDFNDHTMAPGMYPVTGMVTGFTSSHTPVLQDTGSSTVTVDNTPAADVAGLSGTTGDTLNILEWTNPGDVDFADVLILRETAGPVGVGPVEGTTYLPGNMIGGATVVYSGPDESFSDFGLINGTAYHYKIFTRDLYSNYSAGLDVGPLTPNTVLCSSVVSPVTTDFICTGNLDITGGVVFDLVGDIRFEVKGDINITGAGTRLTADPLNAFVRIIADNINVGPGALIDSAGLGCGPSESYDYSANPPVCISLGETSAAVSGFGEGGNDTSGAGGGGGAGYGGSGGAGSLGGLGGNSYGTIDLATIMPGSGGGNNNNSGSNPGGAGGGAVKIEVSGTLAVDGVIRVNGANGVTPAASSFNGGGGSGGSLHITVGTLAGSGTMSANGGSGGTGVPNVRGGGGGGGGRIFIDIGLLNSFMGDLHVMGGDGTQGAAIGGPGSVLVLDNSTGPRSIIAGGSMFLDDLFDPGNNDGEHNYTSLEVIPVGDSGNPLRDRGIVELDGDLNLTLPLNVNAGLKINGDSTLTVPDLTVGGTGELIFNPDGLDPVQFFSRISATNITVDSSGIIHATGNGCPGRQGFNLTDGFGCTFDGAIGIGRGEDGGGPRGAGGGGYGGAGGWSGSGVVAGGSEYGSVELDEIMPGSGGGLASGTAGAGGGALKIEAAGTMIINGELRVDGEAGGAASSAGGGGSGGSLLLDVGTLNGSGNISANGGTGGAGNALRGGGGGGGGRIRINSDTLPFTGTCETSGGLAGNGGGAIPGFDGTIAARQRPDAIVDGNGTNVFGAAGTGDGGTSDLHNSRAGAQPASYNVYLKNQDIFCSTELHSYNMSWTTPGPGWTVSILEGTTTHSTPFVTGGVAPGSERTLVVKVIPSAAILPGKYDVILDAVSALDATRVDSLTLRVWVRGADGIIDGNGDDLYGAAGTGDGGVSTRSFVPGETQSYGLFIQNDGTASSSYTLSWNTPPGWPAGSVVISDGITEQVSGFTTAVIGSENAAGFSIKVTPPVTETLPRTIVVDMVSTAFPVDLDSIQAVVDIPGATPAAPTVFPPIAASDSELKLFWIDNSDNETGFRIERALQVGGACDGDEVYAEVYTLMRDPSASTRTGDFLGTTDGGLSPATTYCYRFLAYNAAGDSSYGGPVSGTTAGAAADADPPGTTMDLLVVPGTQHATSLIVSWTAPPDDSLAPGVGKAMSYDLRYATLPIVDGAPGPGQIDFAAATSVAGLSAPKGAGQPEQATVNGLIPNTIYFVALKSADEAGNISAMSNLAGGDGPTDGSISGRTALRPGFNLVSIPLEPPSGPTCDPPAPTINGDDPGCTFGDDIGGTPSLSAWIPSGLLVTEGCYESSPLSGSDCDPQVEITAVAPGKGYFLLGGGNSPVIDVPAGSAAVTTDPGPICTLSNVYIVPVSLGWNIIGNPFIDRLGFAAVYVRQNGAACLTLADAVTSGWVGDKLFEYNGASYDPLVFGTAVLEPWKAYWFFIRNNDIVDGTSYELIVPKP